MFYLAILIGKLSSLIIRLLSFGSGSTWPGHIALIIDPKFILHTKEKNTFKTVTIIGTNGKTTTSLMLQKVLQSSGLKTFHNKEGANLKNGVASSLLGQISLFGAVSADVAIFELDENAVVNVLSELHPEAIILLNLFRDQLDRYGEVNIIADKWRNVLSGLSKSTQLIANADDPQIRFIAQESKLPTSYYSIDDEEYILDEIPYDVDSVFCPNCGNKLEYNGISYSHLGNYYCETCSFKNDSQNTFKGMENIYPLLGTYNMYNTNAVILASQQVFGLSHEQIDKGLKEVSAAFGRQEQIRWNGKDFFIVLAKNPTGFNQAISIVTKKYSAKKHDVIVLLNDRIPDGTDVSWIWDVDFEKLHGFANNLIISGDRAFDMGLRFLYEQEAFPTMVTSDTEVRFNNVTIYEEFSEALNSANGEDDVILLATYSAMLDARKFLTGKDIL